MSGLLSALAPHIDLELPPAAADAVAAVRASASGFVYEYVVDADKLVAAGPSAGIVAAGALKLPVLLLAGALGVLAAASAVLAVRRGSADSDDGAVQEDPALPRVYTPEGVTAYFASRPTHVAARSLQVAGELLSVGLPILWDMYSGQYRQNEARRARAARLAIDRLGPAYVKVAQALSTRVDILSEAYLREVQLLQDRVRPFDTATAVRILESDLGVPLEEAFEAMSEQPVASASLGQVYKARLTQRYGGGEVAVKVQRPGVLESVALDLYLMRSTADWLRKK